MLYLGGTDYIGDHFHMMYPAGSCLIFSESFQIFLGNGIAFKFQMDPGIILPYIVKILDTFAALPVLQSP